MKTLEEKIDPEKLEKIFASYPQIKLVYLFGSAARQDMGPMSDFDFAVFLDNKDTTEAAYTRFQLMGELSCILGTDNVDVVILDTAKSPEFKYNVIREGELIFEKEPFRVTFEPTVLNEYFDFSAMLRKYSLTRA